MELLAKTSQASKRNNRKLRAKLGQSNPKSNPLLLAYGRNAAACSRCLQLGYLVFFLPNITTRWPPPYHLFLFIFLHNSTTTCWPPAWPWLHQRCQWPLPAPAAAPPPAPSTSAQTGCPAQQPAQKEAVAAAAHRAQFSSVREESNKPCLPTNFTQQEEVEAEGMTASRTPAFSLLAPNQSLSYLNAPVLHQSCRQGDGVRQVQHAQLVDFDGHL